MDVIGQTIGTRKLDGTNIVNPEDALKYVPNLVVRKRFIGDTDGAISIRGTNMSQPARTSVFIDGIPLSNFLGNDSDYSPRRRLIASDEIQSIDVMYGPYSARYSGAIRARMSEGSRSFQRRAWQSPLPASRWMRPDGTWGRRWEGWKIAREPE
ncbi:TonB-dependent receptor plug domain-containing protein [Sphingopyxis sp. LARHCG72]